MARKDTEEQLERAALGLLKQQGVLAGLNLRAVADLAGVNRGNVYHYFGSRRQLLQSALRRRLSRNRYSVENMDTTSLPTWIGWFFQFMIRQTEPIELAALLVLDGDRKQEIMTFHDDVVEVLKLLQARGEISENFDPVVLHVLISAATRGYIIHRKPFARQVGIGVRDLDARVETMLGQLLAATTTGNSETTSMGD